MRFWPRAETLSKEQAQSLLLEGTVKGSIRKIDKALAAGADIDYAYNKAETQKEQQYLDSVFEKDVTVIYLALCKDREDIALALLERGANPLQTTLEGWDSPIHQATWKGMDEFIEAAARKHPLKHLSAAAGKPIFSANITANIKGMKALVAAGEDINSYDSERTTPLFEMLTAKNFVSRDLLYVQALLDAGADLNARAPDGKALIGSILIIDPFLPTIVEHLEKLREHVRCGQGAGMKAERLVKDGKPTTELLHYCGADMVGELFTEHRWHGKEAEALALFDKVRACVSDYYKPRIDQIDLSALRRAVTGQASGPAVARYVRPSKATEIER